MCTINCVHSKGCAHLSFPNGVPSTVLQACVHQSDQKCNHHQSKCTSWCKCKQCKCTQMSRPLGLAPKQYRCIAHLCEITKCN